jgi:hypothetical protein
MDVQNNEMLKIGKTSQRTKKQITTIPEKEISDSRAVLQLCSYFTAGWADLFSLNCRTHFVVLNGGQCHISLRSTQLTEIEMLCILDTCAAKLYPRKPCLQTYPRLCFQTHNFICNIKERH